MPNASEERTTRAVIREGASTVAVATAAVVVIAVAMTVVVAAVVVSGGVRAGAAPRVADLVWDELADCESGGDWRADTGNGFYGGLQIQPPTWAESGGLHFADRPDHANRREQTTVGEEIVRQQGWEAWPSCARQLGLLG
ncbi:transglycosylase family protein [Kitasatospora sp. NPDC101157]|uniref:transglycosylase family protein n=1 Tax=Kitasatospora sp. NPDC101157 TaxID=3364098 RepID=UPI003810D7C0